jgi:transmembrane sensor
MEKPMTIKPEALIRYLSGDISVGEKSEVDAWRNMSEENEKLFREYEQIWKSEYRSVLSDHDLGLDWGRIWKRIGFESHQRRIGIWSGLAKFAAVFVLLLAVSSALFTYWNVPGFGRWDAFSTGNSVDSLRLPDNSMVFLNNYSSIKYLKNFERGQRMVQLKGEGFFEVEHDADNPFLIQTDDGVHIRVLGTSFHLKTGDDLESMELNVAEGKVLLTYNDFSEDVEAGNSVIVEGQTFKVIPYRDMNFLSWKTGELKFSQSSLKTIVQTLQKHYDEVEKVKLNTNSDVLVTTTFRNESLSEILDELEIHFGKKFHLNEGVLTISD